MALRIGTRSSELAIWQAKSVQNELIQAGIESVLVEQTSAGDRSLGGNLSTSVGQFIHSIDKILLTGEIDISVHSSKDVPVEGQTEISSLAYMKRGVTADLIIIKKDPKIPLLEEVLDNESSHDIAEILHYFQRGSTIGTVSGRRQSLILNQRPDLIPLSVRGHVETRLSRLLESRVDGLILAEVGLQRLRQTSALDSFKGKFSAFRIDEHHWPTAPGQGAVSVHCLTERYDELSNIRAILNHGVTEEDVKAERNILRQLGGGCLYPAGVRVNQGVGNVAISPSSWRKDISEGREFKVKHVDGLVTELDLELPKNTQHNPIDLNSDRKIISTLNSDRISVVLAQKGIPMQNLPVVDLQPIVNSWPDEVISKGSKKKDWPYLILTSPFAARCAVEISKIKADYARIQWLAIGEGTARACFRMGHTVAICGKSRNSRELLDYITKKIPKSTQLLLPRSSESSEILLDGLTAEGFEVISWIGYNNKPKSNISANINQNDVLLLSSSSSAISWSENKLNVPNKIICMGENAKKTIQSLDWFSGTEVSVLNGPTTDFLVQWWSENGGVLIDT